MSATKERHILSYSQRERYKREIETERAELRGELPSLKGTDLAVSARRKKYFEQFDRPDIRPDAGIVNARIQRLERVLANGSPVPLTRREKVGLEKEAALLRGALQKRMVPQSYFRLNQGDPNFRKAVAKCKEEHTPEFQKAATRYKDVMRQLAPDDPDASSLETIRPGSN